MNKKNRNGITLLLLALIFIVPMVLAWFFYQKGPANSVNHGTLINPLISMEKFHLTQVNGINYPKKNFYGKWQLLYLVPGQCERVCQNNLYKIRQVRLALNKEMTRVERVVLTFGQPASQLKTILKSRYPEVPLLAFNKLEFIRFTKGRAWQESAIKNGAIYIVDPQGYLMMRYQLSQEPKAIHRDLKRLLKVSQVG